MHGRHPLICVWLPILVFLISVNFQTNISHKPILGSMCDHQLFQRLIQSTCGVLCWAVEDGTSTRDSGDEGMDWTNMKVKQNELCQESNGRWNTARKPRHYATALLAWCSSVLHHSILTLSCQWSSSTWSSYSYKSTHCLNSRNSLRTGLIFTAQLLKFLNVVIPMQCLL